jgi:5'-nucleotidase
MSFPRLTALFLALLATACAAPMASRAPIQPVTVGIIAINDFHGALEPPKQSVLAPDGKGDFLLVPAGGAAWLASAIDSVRAKYPHHLTVSAGDLIGGTPITSALFLDEPAIGVMNRIGLDYSAVGNHELDHGVDELARKQNGGCVQHGARKPCQVEQFKGAKFALLAGNSFKQDGSTLFPATGMRSFGSGRSKVNVGIIGLTLKETGGLIPPEAAKGLRFGDEAETANALVPGLKAQGADAIVLLIHQGGFTKGRPGSSSCENLTYEIRQILDRLDTRIDVVVSGHTHWEYVCDYSAYNPAKPFLLTSAGLWGKLVTDITLEIDPANGRVISKRAKNVIVQSPSYTSSTSRIQNTDLYPMFEPRSDIAEYVARYVAAAADYSLRKIGTIAGTIDRASGPLSNTGGSLAMLIADAQLAATTGAGAQIALMNPFGVRRTLTAAPDGSVTFGDIYAVQPFGNDLVTQSLTGAELKAILEQGFDSEGPEQILAPSAGFAYSYDRSQAIGSRISSMILNGAPIDPAKTYRITTNQFLSNGGDSYSGFLKARDEVIGTSDIAALEAWLKAVPPRAGPTETRTTDLRPELNPNRDTTPPGQKYR